VVGQLPEPLTGDRCHLPALWIHFPWWLVSEASSQNAPAAILESGRGGGKAALVIECLCGHPEKMADGARFVCDFQPLFRALAQSIDDGEDQVSANL
jgi:hypothetical protein